MQNRKDKRSGQYREMITIADITEVIGKYGTGMEHLMLILRELETRSAKNFLDEAVLRQVAERMNIPESAVAGFTGFYSMFSIKPRAKYVIRVCSSGPCHVMGSTDIIHEVGSILGIGPGESTPDGIFFLEQCQCLGICSAAPAMMVNYDLHGNLTPEKMREIFNNYRPGRPAVSEYCGPETEAAGCIIDSRQTRRLLDCTGKADVSAAGVHGQNNWYKALGKAVAMDRQEVINIVRDSGLRGRGGAGFPTGVKWSLVSKGDMRKYVICNADEGEPGTFKDRILMEENPHGLIEGMAICGYAVSASTGYIYVRGEYRRAIERLSRAVEQARCAGYIGRNIFGFGFSFDIFIKEGGGAYVCGEETSLINSMEGRRGYPGFKPPYPGEAGFMNKPSVVNNVETLISVPMIIEKGPDWYRSAGLPGCTGTKLYSLSGKLSRTGLVELPMGATLRELIEVHGGGMKPGSNFKFAQVGGAAGGILGPDMLDLPLDFDTLKQNGLTLGSGAVLVCDEQTCAVDFIRRVFAFFEHESCGQCVPCRTGTAHLHHLIRKFAERRAEALDIELMVKISGLMQAASLCALGQSPALPLNTVLRYFRNEFLDHCNHGFKCIPCNASLEL